MTPTQTRFSLLTLLIKGNFRSFEEFKYFAEFLDCYEYILPNYRVIVPYIIVEMALATPKEDISKCIFLWSMIVEGCFSREEQVELAEFLRKKRNESIN